MPIMFIFSLRDSRTISWLTLCNPLILRAQWAVLDADYFDRYIRNEKHYQKTVEYIENNPVKARLCARSADYRFSSAWFREHRAESTQLLTGTAGALARK